MARFHYYRWDKTIYTVYADGQYIGVVLRGSEGSSPLWAYALRTDPHFPHGVPDRFFPTRKAATEALFADYLAEQEAPVEDDDELLEEVPDLPAIPDSPFTTADIKALAARITVWPDQTAEDAAEDAAQAAQDGIPLEPVVYLTEAERAALALATQDLIDKCFDSISAADSLPAGRQLPERLSPLVRYLPRRYALRYSGDFHRKMCAALIEMAGKLSGSTIVLGQLPSTLAEELALHAFIERAKDLWQFFLDEGYLDRADPSYRGPVEFLGSFEEVAFWDSDYRFLYEDERDGFAESEEGQNMRIAPQDFASWFTVTYGERSQHPYLAA
jgi:hypothetical protein